VSTVVYSFSKRKVQFIHESVKDFLLSVKGLQLLDSSLNQQLVGNSHGRLASSCYSYIMMTSLESLERETANQEGVNKWTRKVLEQSYPFLSYAGEFILRHIEDAEMGGVSQLELLKKLQPGSNGIRRLRRSKEILDLDYESWSNGSEVMHVAAEMGFYEIFRRSLEEIKVSVDVVGGFYGTALQAAAAGGHEKIVQLLLEHGANVNTVTGWYTTALKAAAATAHETIVQLLLEHGADVNTISGFFGTVLQAAAKGGHEKIVRILLERGADVNTISGYFGTALQAAAKGGHKKIVRILLERGADVNTVSGHYSTALQAAAAEGKKKIVQLLLEHGADVNITGGLWYTALHGAVVEGSEPIARTLLEHGANVNARGGIWGTVLNTARFRRCNQACIDLLLEYGAEDHPPIKELSDRETKSAGADSAEAEAESD
jgi:ankyrin repeat protein